MELAGRPTVGLAISGLAATPYGYAVHEGQSVQRAQHAVAATLLWNLRVMAGWLPAPGVRALRALAGWFEIANVDKLLNRLAGGDPGPSFSLGALATAWPRLESARSVSEVRAVLATSEWGRPDDDPWALRVKMQLAWAARVRRAAPDISDLVAAAAALLAIRLWILEERVPSSQTTVALSDLLPEAAGSSAAEVIERLQRLPAPTFGLVAQPLRAAGDLLGAPGVARSSGSPAAALSAREAFAIALWKAELGWWQLAEETGFQLLRRSAFSAQPIVGAVLLLAVDAWRARAALGAAAGGALGRELFDALA
jgi:hypothetical protein